MSPARLAQRRWAGFLLCLVPACPVACCTAYFLGVGGAVIGGTWAAAVAEIIVVPGAGFLIWRWNPSGRDRALRAVAVASICVALAVGGAFAVFVVHMFSSPDWDF